MKTVYRKDIRLSHMARLLRRSFACAPFSAGDLSGEVALVRMEEVRAPLVVKHGETGVRVADAGFFWLEAAPRARHWWLTAALDENGGSVVYARSGGETEFTAIPVETGMETDYYIEISGEGLSDGMEVKTSANDTATAAAGADDAQQSGENAMFSMDMGGGIPGGDMPGGGGGMPGGGMPSGGPGGM